MHVLDRQHCGDLLSEWTKEEGNCEGRMERGSYNRVSTGPSAYLKVSRAQCIDEFAQSVPFMATLT